MTIRLCVDRNFESASSQMVYFDAAIIKLLCSKGVKFNESRSIVANEF
jgi:hypothetical protein